MVKMYGVPSCNKIRDSKKLLEEHQVEFEFVNVKKAPLSKTELKSIAEKLGMEQLYNLKGPTFRKLKLNFNDMTESEKLDKLYENQNMIKRPLLEKNGKFRTGFDKDKILEFLK